MGEPGRRGVALTKVRVYDILIAQLNVIVNCISFANKKRRWWPPFFVWELLLVLSIQPFAYVICNNTSKKRQKNEILEKSGDGPLRKLRSFIYLLQKF